MGDWYLNLVVVAAFIVGGIGFPVVFELRRAWRRPREWSLHTKVTLATTALLLFGGTLMVAAVECVGKRLADTDMRAKYQVTVVCIKPDGGSCTYATADTVVGAGDPLVIAGSVEAADRFVEKTGR